MGTNRVVGACAALSTLLWIVFWILHPAFVGNPHVLSLSRWTASALRSPPAHALAGVWWSLFNDPVRSGAVLALLLAALFALYFFALRRVRRATGLAIVLVPAAIYLLPLAASLPVFSVDVFTYVAVGELADAGRNPYDVVIRDEKWLESLPYAPRSRHGSPYSPMAARLFQLARAEGLPVVTHLLALRLVMVAALVGSIAFLVGAMRASGRSASEIRVAALALSWSPLVLIDGVMGAHVDVLILLLLTAGLFALARGRTAAGLAILALTPSIRITCLFMLPALAAFAFHRGGGGRRGTLAVLGLSAWTAAAYFVWLLPDWTSVSPIETLTHLQLLASKSLTFALRFFVRQAGSNGQWLHGLMRVAFALVLLYRVHTVRTREQLYTRLSRDWLVYLLFFMPWLNTWYLIAAFGPVWVAGRRHHEVTLLLFSAAFLITYLSAPMARGVWTPGVQFLVYGIGVLPASLYFLWSSRARTRQPQSST